MIVRCDQIDAAVRKHPMKDPLCFSAVLAPQASRVGAHQGSCFAPATDPAEGALDTVVALRVRKDGGPSRLAYELQHALRIGWQGQHRELDEERSASETQVWIVQLAVRIVQSELIGQAQRHLGKGLCRRFRKNRERLVDPVTPAATSGAGREVRRRDDGEYAQLPVLPNLLQRLIEIAGTVVDAGNQMAV